VSPVMVMEERPRVSWMSFVSAPAASAAAGVGEADHGLGGGDRPDAVPVGEAGRDVGHDGQQLSAGGVELIARLLQGEREALDLGVPC
jgi:hypothetical protein